MNPYRCRFVVALPCAMAAVGAIFFALAPKTKPAQTTLSFADRVAYQRAIEEVYWQHRIWPKANVGRKPPLDKVMAQAEIEKKVEDYLHKSQAREDYWQQPITPDQLQAEMERIASHTKQPGMLREIFAALGNDPFVIAECLARPVLAERLVSQLYVHDQRFHGELKRRAEAELKKHRTVKQMRHTSGMYTEMEWIKTDPAQTGPVSVDTKSVDAVKMNGPEWQESVEKLAGEFGNSHPAAAGVPPAQHQKVGAIAQIKTGVLSPLQEDEGHYYAVAVMNKGRDRLKLATIAWLKEPVRSWLAKAETQTPVTLAAVSANYTLPIITSASGGCTNETWTATSITNAAAGRSVHSAVWTGTEMIVWGGVGDIAFNTGGRYNPSTDSWTATSITNAPSARYVHTAVWTGSQMIIWGGTNGGGMNTGGRYNPATDNWTPTSTTGAPAARLYHTAVWTGSQMIVWGGSNGSKFNNGGKYDPSTDSWTATSTTEAPAARYLHTAVWTGTEMIVWGGSNGSSFLNTGGRYSPSTDTWTATSTTNTPSARWEHTAVWTGSQMIIWGGVNDSSGGKYNPSTDSWTATTLANAPDGRAFHTVVWTGSEMVVWGGYNGNPSLLNTGSRYNPSTDSWTATDTTGAPAARQNHTAVWTGTEMIIWGGSSTNQVRLDTGGRYCAQPPSSCTDDTWTTTSTTNAPAGRYYHTAVWTGSEMIVWGGNNGSSSLNTGGRYDPSTDTWTATSATNAPSARSSHKAVWTGTEMIVWGGLSDNSPFYLNTGGRYNPGANSWTATNTTNAPSARYAHTAIWTGTEMIVWGGFGGSALNTGGRYSPGTNSWTATSTTNAPAGRYYHTAVWSGSEMIVWSGFNGSVDVNTGGKYSPGTNSWTATSTTNAPSARDSHTAVWSGSEMIVWGGTNSGNNLKTGGRYNPAVDSWTATSTTNAPASRYVHTAVWTGSEMIVWGGQGNLGFLDTGGRYTPGTDSWTDTTTSNAPTARINYPAIWTSNEMIVWGGYAGSALNTGGRYCAQSGAPTPTPTPTATPTATPTPTPTPVPVRVTLTATPTQITEGQSATYKVRASTAAAQDTIVSYSMSGTATSGSDYTLNPSGGQVTILAGQSSAQVKLKAKTDGLIEGSETAIMTLQPGSGYRLGNPKEATVSILDP